MEYQEGDIAEDGNGNFMVYRGGSWHPSTEQGRPLQRIPRPDYGDRYYELPNGDIVREGPRGGLTVVENVGGGRGGQSSGNGAPAITSEQRGRLVFGIAPASRAQNRLREQEAGDRAPLNEDWGAALVDMIPDFGALNTVARLWGGTDYQAYDQASASIEAALLPIFSGMAVTDSEAKRFIRANLPRLGDAPETLAEKARNREEVINAGAWLLGRDLPFPEVGIYGQEGLEPSDREAVPIAAAGNGGSGSGAQGAPAPQGPIDISGMSAAELLQLQPGTAIRLPDGTVTRLTGAPSIGAQGREVSPGVFTQETPQDVIEARRNSGEGIGRKIDAAVRGAADTITFGLSDEIAAGANSVIPLDRGSRSIWTDGLDAYSNNLAIQRGVDQADAEQVPVSRAVGQIAGGLAGGAAAVRSVPAVGRFAAGGASRVSRAGRAAAVGGAYGGAYGFGSGEGNALQRADEAAVGTAIGAGAGLAAPVAVNLGQRVVSPVTNALADAGRAIARPVVNALGDSAPAVVRNVVEVNPLARAAERFVGTNQPNINALRAEQARLEADVGRAVPAAAVVNTGGRGLLRGVAMRSDAARQIAEDFGEGTAEALPGRMSQQARRIVSADNRPPDQIRAELTDRRSNLAREEYAGPYAQPVEIGEDIARALSGAPGRTAIQRARAAAEAWQEDAVMAELDALQAAVASGQPLPRVSAGAVDRIRQALAGRGEKLAQNPATRAVGAGVQRRAGQVDAALDNVEGLAPARQTYRNLSEQIEAVDLGSRALSANPDEVIAAMAGASPQSQAAFRAGLARNIETAAGNTTTAPGVANRLAIPNTPTRQVMDATLGADDAERLARAARGERDLNRRAQRVNPGAGSPTAQNDRDFARAAGVGTDIMSGRLGSAAMRVVDMVRSRGFNDAQAEALLEAMTDPQRTNEVIDLLAERMTRREARNLARAIRYQLTTGPQSGQQN